MKNFKNSLLYTLFGIILGLLAGALVVLVAARPRGQPVQLLPAPTPAPILVDVGGAVGQPGVYALPRDSRVQDAIQAAGGFSEAADPALVNLAARLHDGDKVTIPVKGQASHEPVLQEQEAAGSSSPTRIADNRSAPAERSTPASPPAGPINLNTATLDELQTLPGIGPTKAQDILDYRQAHGPFKTIEELQDVKGIGQSTFEKLKEFITVQ